MRLRFVNPVKNTKIFSRKSKNATEARQHSDTAFTIKFKECLVQGIHSGCLSSAATLAWRSLNFLLKVETLLYD